MKTKKNPNLKKIYPTNERKQKQSGNQTKEKSKKKTEKTKKKSRIPKKTK